MQQINSKKFSSGCAKDCLQFPVVFKLTQNFAKTVSQTKNKVCWEPHFISLDLHVKRALKMSIHTGVFTFANLCERRENTPVWIRLQLFERSFYVHLTTAISAFFKFDRNTRHSHTILDSAHKTPLAHFWQKLPAACFLRLPVLAILCAFFFGTISWRKGRSGTVSVPLFSHAQGLQRAFVQNCCQ